jgi:Ca2+-binding EF-hand superfamily protein
MWQEFNTVKKEEEIRGLFSSFEIGNARVISHKEGLTVLKTAGFDRSMMDMKPFFNSFCANDNMVTLPELQEILRERLQEERRAKAFEHALNKIDHLNLGSVSVSDAVNILHAMTDDRLAHVIEEKKNILLEQSKFQYHHKDLHPIVRRFK